MNLFGRMFEQPRKNSEAENSSGGSEMTEHQPQPAEGEIFFTDEDKRTEPMSGESALAPFLIKPKEETTSKPIARPKKQKESVKKPIQSKKEPRPVSAEWEEKEEPLKKGDVFENTTNGERLSVEGEETRQDMPGILYTEAYLGGALKNEGKVMWKPTKGFRVLTRGEEMKKNDPIKETYPEFYVKYGEQMTKADNVFAREFEASRIMMDAWEKYIADEYHLDPLKEIDKNEEEKTEEEKMVGKFQFIRESIEAIGRKWNKLDDRIVEQGRQELALLARLRALESSLPEYALELKTSELRLLGKEQASDEPDAELVEKGYQTILLEKKKEAITERYNKVVDSNTVVAQDMPLLNAFKDQINSLYLSMNEESSSKDIRKTIDEIAVIERQMFAKKEKNNDENSEVLGRFVKGKAVQKQGYKEKNAENEGKKKKYVRNRVQGKHQGGDENSEYSPFVIHGNGVELNGNTNTMSSGETFKQGDSAVKADDVHHTPTAETAEDILWRAELDKFQTFPEGQEAVEKLKEMLVEEWGIFEQKLLDEARKRDIRIFPDEVAKLWRDSLLRQLREMAIEYLNRYQAVPIKNGRNIFNAIIRTLEGGREGTGTESRSRVSGPVEEMNGDLSKEMTDSLLVRVKNHLDLNEEREKPAVLEQEQEKEELSNEEQFAILAEALRSKRKPFGLDKGGKELVIEEISESGTEIKYRYGEKRGLRVTPKYVKKFLSFLKENFSWTPRALQEKRAVSTEEAEARGIMRQVDDVIQRKRGLAKDIFENSMNVETVSEDGYKHFVGYLNDMGRDAERFFGEGDIKGLRSIFEKANGSEFKLEKLEDKKSATRGEEIVTPVVSPQPKQEQSKERTYEELEKTLTKIKRKSCIGIVSEGLTPYENERIAGQAEYPNLTLKEVVDYYGVDVVAKSFAPAVAKLLPGEWNEAERNLFALEFIKREIVGCFE